MAPMLVSLPVSNAVLAALQYALMGCGRFVDDESAHDEHMMPLLMLA